LLYNLEQTSCLCKVYLPQITTKKNNVPGKKIYGSVSGSLILNQEIQKERSISWVPQSWIMDPEKETEKFLKSYILKDKAERLKGFP